MGNCIISINVTGAHHNGVDYDIDQLSADFVATLKARGHNVTAATLVTGGEYNLLDEKARFPLVGAETAAVQAKPTA